MENTLVQWIPESRLPKVEAALLETFGSNAIDSMEQLSGGLSGSAVYKVTIHHRPYVMKLDAPSVPGNPALALASAAGIAPRLRFQDLSAGVTITDFIESAPIKTAFTAFVNDRYVDLATAANFFIHNAEQETQFLQVYFDGQVDEYKSARFYVMRQISRIVYAILLVQVAVRSKPSGQPLDQEMEGNTLAAFGERMAAGKLSMATQDGQLMYGKAQLNEALRQMRSARFAAALGLL